MKIGFVDGRDFRESDTYPGVAIVSEMFAKQFFNGESPIGKSFVPDGSSRYQIVGLVRDAPYRDMREPILPVAYIPFHRIADKGTPEAIDEATFIVRTATTRSLALSSTLRREVARARPEFRVRTIRTQAALVQAQTVRERLLATLALFFAVVALLLVGVGLYGVLDYSVVQQRREIGIRIAIGARPVDIAQRVTLDVFSMVLMGALAGLALGMASARYIEALLYQVKPTDLAILVLPSLTILNCTLFDVRSFGEHNGSGGTPTL